MDAIDGFDEIRVRSRLEINKKTELSDGCPSTSFFDAQTPGHVNSDGLGDVDMPTRIYGGGGLLGMKIRRALNCHGIYFLEELHVALEPCVPAGIVDIQFVTEIVDFILEIVGAGGNPVSTMLSEQTSDPGAPNTAADHSNVDFGVCFIGPDALRCEDRNGQSCRTRAAHQVPARSGRFVLNTYVGLGQVRHFTIISSQGPVH